MNILFKMLRVLYGIYALFIFVVLMLVAFPFVIVASFFGHIKGGNAIYRICMWWADAWFFMAGIRHRNIFIGPEPAEKQFVFVANHISYLDAAIIVKAIRRPIRPLGKAEMTRIPVFGYIYRKVIVTVDRKNASNRAKSLRILRSVLRKNISIFFFPEGTFNMSDQPLKSFYDGAFRLAIETQTPIKPLLFIDSFNRMHHRHVFTLNPGLNRVIHLPEIPVDTYTLADVPILKEYVYNVMQQELINWNAGWIK